LRIKWTDLNLPPINQRVLPDALSFQEMQMTSPCVGLCQVEDGVCQGCDRTLEEIQNWAYMTDDEREEIMERLL